MAAATARGSASVDRRRWNHNIHYHSVLLDAIPKTAEQGLDVGCGEGTLTRKLRRHVDHVTAIDVHQPSIELARRQGSGEGIDYLLGDFLTWDCEPASFDVIVSVAALHHMNVTAALQRMHQLLRPGGTLAILGLARSRHPGDLPRDAAATLVNRLYRITNGHWESAAPTVWPPPHTYREIQSEAERTLGQIRFRRHLLWRYSLIWTKPP